VRAVTSRFLALALTASTVALGAPVGPVLTPGPLSSVPRNGNARIETVATASSPASTVASCRTYFRASGSGAFYFLEMKRGDAGRYWAVLPIPSEGTKAVEFKVVAKDSAGQESSTAVVSVPVADVSASLSAEEAKAASNLIVGLTEAGQTGVPVGFRCDGIVNVIATSGELRPNDECRKAAAGGIPTLAWVGAGAGVVAAGALIINNNSGGGGKPVSPSRPPSSPPLN
jgi:hypothetical protein